MINLLKPQGLSEAPAWKFHAQNDSISSLQLQNLCKPSWYENKAYTCENYS